MKLKQGVLSCGLCVFCEVVIQLRERLESPVPSAVVRDVLPAAQINAIVVPVAVKPGAGAIYLDIVANHEILLMRQTKRQSIHAS